MNDILTANGFLAALAEMEKEQVYRVIDPSHQYYDQRVLVRAESGRHWLIHPVERPNPTNWRWIEAKSLVMEQ